MDAVLERVLAIAFPRARVLEASYLAEGYRHANWKVDLHGLTVVVRVYRANPALCRKEIDLIRLVGPTVPVPEILHAEPDGRDGLPPFLVTRYIEAITFRELRRTEDTGAIAQASASLGETLAAIHRHAFDRGGWLLPGPTVGPPLIEGTDSLPRFVDRCLEHPVLQRRLAAELREGVRHALWSQAAALAVLERQHQLAHGDFNKRNTLVRQDAGMWRTAAILDWEFAVSATPLMDLGNFLRYERASRPFAEPHFSEAYRRAGGQLPEDWRRLARLVDLVALCAALIEEALPGAAEAEIIELVAATVAGRDPLL